MEFQVVPTASCVTAYPSVWMPVLSVLFGAVIGYGLTELKDFFARRRERKGHLESLAAEIRMCGNIARGYLSAGIPAPAYRMPLVAHNRSLAIVLAYEALRPGDREALSRFYVNAESFN